MTINEQFKEYGVVPVVVLNDAKDALPLAKALVEGGLACAEVTFRTDAAEESIRLMSEAYPEMLVGAGTVLTIDQVNRAVKAGAKFIVSPGFDPEIVDLSCDKILCCGGSWMVKGDMIKAGEFDKITAMTKEAVAKVKEIRG